MLSTLGFFGFDVLPGDPLRMSSGVGMSLLQSQPDKPFLIRARHDCATDAVLIEFVSAV